MDLCLIAVTGTGVSENARKRVERRKINSRGWAFPASFWGWYNKQSEGSRDTVSRASPTNFQTFGVNDDVSLKTEGGILAILGSFRLRAYTRSKWCCCQRINDIQLKVIIHQ